MLIATPSRHIPVPANNPEPFPCKSVLQTPIFQIQPLSNAQIEKIRVDVT